MANEGGSHECAWAVFLEPRILGLASKRQILEEYLRVSEAIPGWTRHEETLEL
jgi:hypothetical protein